MTIRTCLKHVLEKGFKERNIEKMINRAKFSKFILWGALGVLAVFGVYTVFFRLGGGLVGNVTPIPNLKTFCGNLFGFPRIFCNVLEFYEDHTGSLGRAVGGGHYGGVGICQI